VVEGVVRDDDATVDFVVGVVDGVAEVVVVVVVIDDEVVLDDELMPS
jgi:hypothetical protein